MSNKKLAILIGTRPGIIKMSPVFHAIKSYGLNSILIHSGQHYSVDMDKQIMKDVDLPSPDFHFIRPENCVSHAEQTAFMLTNIESALLESKPDLLFVCGDANTNFAGALACRKLNIPLAHVEAGLRSFDWRMPEEHNRRMIDHISDLLFSPTIECVKNLEHENVLGKIYCVGNTVADAALRFKPKKIVKTKNILLTLHREENVDDNQILKHLLIQIEEILDHCDLNADFFIHPRTKKRLDEFNLWSILSSRISIKSPLNYLGFLQKICESKFILTDSGGLQEEACILGTPCYTLRKSTERPETVECGANLVLGVDEPAKIFKKSNLISTNKDWLSPFGDGHTANHIVKNSIEWLKENNL